MLVPRTNTVPVLGAPMLPTGLNTVPVLGAPMLPTGLNTVPVLGAPMLPTGRWVKISAYLHLERFRSII
jgi:hypothetical protein